MKPALLLLPWVFATLLHPTVLGADVRSFGAVGDGRSDDTAAIQRAVDSGQGEIRFSKGVYRLTRTVTIELEKVGFTSLVGEGTAVVEMAGPGPAFHFVGTIRGSASPDHHEERHWKGERMPQVVGMAFVGGHPEAVGIQATRTMQLTVTRSHFRQLLHGIHLTERNRNVLIDACHAYNNHGIGIFVDRCNLHQINIGDCHVSYNRGGGIVVRGGDVRNLQVGNCDIEDNMAIGGPPTANVLLDAADGSIGEMEITGCSIQHSHGAKGSANIRIIARSPKSPRTDELRHGNFVIAGNFISDADINIHLVDVRGVTVSGNVMHIGGSHDLLVERAAHVVIGNLNLDRNPRYVSNSSGVVQGILLRDCSDMTLTGIHIQGGRAPAALDIQGGRRFNISQCTILDVDHVALRLQDVSDSMVSGCLIRNDSDAGSGPRIVIKGGSGNFVSGNHVTGPVEIDAAAARSEGNFMR